MNPTMRIRFTTVLLSLVVVVSFVGVAAAEPLVDAEALIQRILSADDPVAEFNSMTPVEQQAVTEHQTPSTFESASEALADGSDNECLTHVRSYAAYNSLGDMLWRYTSSTFFCFDGEQFTRDPDFATDASVWYLWEFVGNTQFHENGEEGDWIHTDYGEGHFKLCIGPWGIGCILHQYPHISKLQRADGSWTSSAGL